MGTVPPPLPLSPQEVAARIKAGARTLFEIDPALGRWHRRNQAHAAAATLAMIVFIVGVTLIAVLRLAAR